MRWLQIYDDKELTVQTLPMTDNILHVLDGCVCGPTTGTFVEDQAVVYSEILHHPLIGREKSQ